jgi:hypothetical protein
MEMFSHERQTILPPQPSLSRMLLARSTALWFLAVAFWRRAITGLARCARRGIELATPRRTPELAPGDLESSPRLTSPA